MCRGNKDCGPGKQSRARGTRVEAENGGAACVGDESQERDCEVVPCPIHCEWDEWSASVPDNCFLACTQE